MSRFYARVLLSLIFINVVFLNTAHAGDATTTQTATSDIKEGNAQRFVTAYLKINITSENYYSYCAVPGSPPNKGYGTWGSFYTLCPLNSITATTPTINSTGVHNCVCSPLNQVSRNCPLNLMKYGQGGLKVSNIKCLVPIGIWLPQSAFTTGGLTGGITTKIYGQNVYVTSYGTQLFVQPSSTTDMFDITVNGNTTSATISGANAAFLNNFINGKMFQILTITYPGCAGGSGC